MHSGFLWWFALFFPDISVAPHISKILKISSAAPDSPGSGGPWSQQIGLGAHWEASNTGRVTENAWDSRRRFTIHRDNMGITWGLLYSQVWLVVIRRKSNVTQTVGFTTWIYQGVINQNEEDT